MSVHVCFYTRETILSTKEPHPPSRTLHSEEKTDAPADVEDKRQNRGPSLVCEEPPNHVQTSTVSKVLIICKYVGIILRACLVRTLLINKIQICMTDNGLLCCADLSKLAPELRPCGSFMQTVWCNMQILNHLQNNSVSHLFSDVFQFYTVI